MCFSNESMNNDNTNQRKVKVLFNSTIEIVNIVREVNEDVRDVAKDLDDDEGTHGVGEVDHADAEVGVKDPPILCVTSAGLAHPDPFILAVFQSSL